MLKQEKEHMDCAITPNLLPHKVTVKQPTIERLCNRFASAMLLPGDCLMRRLGNTRIQLSLPEIISIRNMYGIISIAAIVHRTHDLGIIDDTEYNRLYDTVINKNIM